MKSEQVPNYDQLIPKLQRRILRLPDSTPHECVVCGQPTAYTTTGQFRKTCSDTCRQKLHSMTMRIHPDEFYEPKTPESTKAKRAATIRERYGENPWNKNGAIRKRINQTFQQKYGANTPFASTDIQERIREQQNSLTIKEKRAIQNKREQTSMERYGVDNPSKSPDIVSRIYATNLEKFGGWNGANPKLIEKRKQTMLEKFGAYPWNKWSNETLELCDQLASSGLSDTAIAEKLNLDRGTVSANLRLMGHNPGNITNPERVIIEFLRENYSGPIKIHDRTELYPYEIDIWAPELRLGIEVNGEYWHNELATQNKFHIRDKWKLAQQAGIQLMNFNALEIAGRTKQVQNFILSKTGSQNEIVHYARKCNVTRIEPKCAVDFINSNHIQPVTVNKFEVSYGLSHDGNLLAVMMFGRHHRKYNDASAVLKRYCCAYNNRVVGGASKLLKTAIRENDWKHIITWSDNRFSNGNMYQKLGFIEAAQLRPDYSYWDSRNDRIVGKQNCTKRKLKCGPAQTEREKALELGYLRIWDCGKTRWEMTIQ